MKRIHWILLPAWTAVLIWSGVNLHDRLTWVLEVMPALIGPVRSFFTLLMVDSYIRRCIMS